MSGKKYKISKEGVYAHNGKIIFYIGLLGLLCVISFLVAKYIVNIDIGEKPIDTSERI